MERVFTCSVVVLRCLIKKRLHHAKHAIIMSKLVTRTQPN